VNASVEVGVLEAKVVQGEGGDFLAREGGGDAGDEVGDETKSFGFEVGGVVDFVESEADEEGALAAGGGGEGAEGVDGLNWEADGDGFFVVLFGRIFGGVEGGENRHGAP
jgi:hypothetical protein